MHWQKVTLIGVGLLGGSLGMALKRRGLAGHIEGYVRRQSTIDESVRLGAVDSAGLDLAAAVTGADLVILCTPLAQMRELTERFRMSLKPGAIITDVGSVKRNVVHELEPIASRAGAHFVGSHPMAGAEKMGVSAARADLFVNAICVVTPSARTAPDALRAVEAFWASVGGRPMRMSALLHDEFISRSSHLPHVIAAELANYVLSPAHPKEQAVLCANGFRDTTRIASGSPEMWRDIAMANRKNLARVLGVFIEDLQEFQLALERQDVKAVQEFFEMAKCRRDQWCGQSNSPE